MHSGVGIGQPFGIQFTFHDNGFLESISDVTLMEHRDTITESFSVSGIKLSVPESGEHGTYSSNDILEESAISSMASYRIEQDGKEFSRKIHIGVPNPDNRIHIIFEFDIKTNEWTLSGNAIEENDGVILLDPEKILLEETIKWTLKGKVIEVDGTKLLDFGNTRIKVVDGEHDFRKDCLEFELENGKNTIIFEIETLPFYEEVEDTLIVINNDQIEKLLVVSSFFTEHKFLPVIVLDIEEEKKLIENKHESPDEYIAIRNKLYRVISDLKPSKIIVLAKTFDEYELGIISKVGVKFGAKVHLVHDIYSKKEYDNQDIVTWPANSTIDILTPLQDIFNTHDLEYISVESDSVYWPVANVISKSMGKKHGKVFVPLVQNDPEFDLRVGSESYGNGEFCSDVVDMVDAALSLMESDSNERVIVEIGDYNSSLRSILGAGYAYLRHTVPLPVVNKQAKGTEVEKLFTDDTISKIKKAMKTCFKQDSLKATNWERDFLSIYSDLIETEYFYFSQLDAVKRYFQYFSNEIDHDELRRICKDDAIYLQLIAFMSSEINRGYLIQLIESKKNDYSWLKNCQAPFNQAKLKELTEYLFIPIIERLSAIQEVKNSVFKNISLMCTKQVKPFINIFNNFKHGFVTVFTDSTPYSLVRQDGEYWASKYAMGHFFAENIEICSFSLINSLLYTMGRKNPISPILIVSPFESMGDKVISTECRRAGNGQLSETGKFEKSAENYWSLVMSLKNEDTKKNLVMDLVNNISWTEVHLATHGSDTEIRLVDGALSSKEIQSFSLKHSMLGLNGCSTYHSSGNLLLSTLAYGGYVTLFPVTDNKADAIGYAVFQGDMDGQPASESLRKGINAVQAGDSKWFESYGYPSPLIMDNTISELAYIFVGLAPSRIYSRKLQNTDHFDICRHRYNNFYSIVLDWIDIKGSEPEVLLKAFKGLSNDYVRELEEADNDIQVADVYFRLATVYYRTRNIKEAVNYGEKSVSIYANLAASGDNKINLNFAHALNNLVHYHGVDGDFSSIPDVLKQLEFVAKQFDQDKDINLVIVMAFSNAGVYYDRSDDISGFHNVLKQLEYVAKQFDQDKDINLGFAKILYDAVNAYGRFNDLSGLHDALKQLELVAKLFNQNKDINLEFAQALFNAGNYYADFGDLSDILDALKQLEFVAKQFNQDKDINLEFAQALLNAGNYYADSGDLSGILDTLKQLELVANHFDQDKDINLIFAQALSNAGKYYYDSGEFFGLHDILRQLELVAKNFNQDKDIDLIFIQSLFNAGNAYIDSGDFSGLHDALRQLELVAKNFNQDKDINLQFAKTLFNACNAYVDSDDFSGLHNVLRQFELVAKNFDQDKDINLQFAKTLFNTGIRHRKSGDFSAVHDILKQLELLAQKFNQDKEINTLFVKLLYNAAYLHSVSGDLSYLHYILEQLEFVAKRFNQDKDINLIFTDTLASVGNVYVDSGDFSSFQDVLRQLEIVVKNFEQDKDINLVFAQALANAGNYYADSGDFSGLHDVLRQLELAAKNFDQDKDINLALAQALFNASNEYRKYGDSSGSCDALSQLELVAKQFDQDKDINLALAQALFNAGNIYGSCDDISYSHDVLRKLEFLAQNFNQDEDINLALAQALVNVGHYYGKSDDLSSMYDVLRQFDMLANHFGQDKVINFLFAQALLSAVINYCRLSNPFGIHDVLTLFEKLTKRFEQDKDINMKFAEALYNASKYYRNSDDFSGFLAVLNQCDQLAQNFYHDKNINKFCRLVHNLEQDKDKNESRRLIHKCGQDKDINRELTKTLTIALAKVTVIIAIFALSLVTIKYIFA